MNFMEERFKEFSRTKGRMRYEAEGNVDEKDFASANHLNSSATIGYSAVEVGGKLDHIFVSRTAKGIVLTMPGNQTGAAPFPIEGYSAVSTVKEASPVNEFYDAHVRALAGDCPVADSAWLEKEVPMLPQRALDVTMKIFAIVCDQMDRLMSGMGNVMGEMMEGMGKAMGQALEGMGEAMGDAVKGAADDAAPHLEKGETASSRKARTARPKKARMPKATKKRARPARKARPSTPHKVEPPAKKPKRKGGPKKHK
jgi:hypothetical protein